VVKAWQVLWLLFFYYTYHTKTKVTEVSMVYFGVCAFTSPITLKYVFNPYFAFAV